MAESHSESRPGSRQDHGREKDHVPMIQPRYSVSHTYNPTHGVDARRPSLIQTQLLPQTQTNNDTLRPHSTSNSLDRVGQDGSESPLSPLSPDGPYPPIPSNAAIEQIIANAMALAGSGPGQGSNHSFSSVSVASNHHVGGNHNINGNVGQDGMVKTPDGESEGRPGVGSRVGSDGYVNAAAIPGGLSGVLQGGVPMTGGRLGGTIGTFQGRTATPIMFHPIAVGVDGRVNLFVGNLPYRVRWQDVKDLFRRAGTVLRADVALDPQSNRSRGHGSVLMGSQEDGIKAIEMFNGYTWQTRVLEVRPDRLPPEYEPHPYVPGPNYGQLQGRMGQGQGQGGMHIGMGMGMGMPYRSTSAQGWGMGGMYQQGSPARSNAQINSNHMHIPGGNGLSHYNQFSDGSGSPSLIHRRPPGQSNIRDSVYTMDRDDSTSGPRDDHTRLPISPTSFSQMKSNLVNASLETLPGYNHSELRSISPTTRMDLVHEARAPTRDEPSRHSANISSVNSQYVFDSRRGSLVGIGHGRLNSARGSGDSTTDSVGRGGLPHAPRPLPSRQDTVGGRLLYVANLPFNLSWQELKDLFRTAGGNVIRTDIALGPDGRSKGYGNVLFQSEEDAAMAVRTFDGYDFNGRTMRVRQDRNSSADPPKSTHSSSESQSVHIPGIHDRKEDSFVGELQSPFHQSSAVSREQLADMYANPTEPHPLSGPPLSIVTNSTTAPGSTKRVISGGASSKFRNGQHPGRIIMPNFNGFGMPNSPSQNRGLPPMTPSMPGYNFHAYPSTPPLHPLSFLSPGVGPFSPTLNSPNAYGFNPFYAAPGAPMMTPGVPHSMNGNGNGYGPPGGQTIAYTPGHGHIHHQNFSHTPGPPRKGERVEPDYFPPVLNNKSETIDAQTDGENAGLGIAPVTASEGRRFSTATISSRSGNTLDSIREQVESLILSVDSTSSPQSRDKSRSSEDGVDRSNALLNAFQPGGSRASFNLGLPGRDALAELLGNQSLPVDRSEREKDRRASMDDRKWT